MGELPLVATVPWWHLRRRLKSKSGTFTRLQLLQAVPTRGNRASAPPTVLIFMLDIFVTLTVTRSHYSATILTNPSEKSERSSFYHSFRAGYEQRASGRNSVFPDHTLPNGSAASRRDRLSVDFIVHRFRPVRFLALAEGWCPIEIMAYVFCHHGDDTWAGERAGYMSATSDTHPNSPLTNRRPSVHSSPA